MRLRPEQLDAHLKKQLLPVYLVSGEEELVVGSDRQSVYYRDPIWLPDRIVYERGEVKADLWRIRGVEAVDS